MGFVLYFFAYRAFGIYELRVKKDLIRCENIYVRGDVLRSNLSEIFGENMKGDDVCTSAFPANSKVISFKIPKRSSLILKDVEITHGNTKLEFKAKDVQWYCNGCEIKATEDGIIAQTKQIEGELETSDYTKIFKGNTKIIFLFFRYFPYIIALGLPLLTVAHHASLNKRIFIVTTLTGTFWIFAYLFYEKLRSWFPVLKVGNDGIVSASSYLGVSIFFDYLLMFLLFSIPFFIYLLVNNKRNK